MIISIDPSLRQTGIYVEQTDKTYILKTTEEENIALHRIYKYIKGIINTYRPEMVVLERSSFGSTGNGVTKLAAVGGIIKVVAIDSGARVFEMSPMTWKSFIFGKHKKDWPKKGTSRASRQEYLAAGEELAAREFATTDEMDAYMIYLTYKRKTE